jgi:hypothetical protein
MVLLAMLLCGPGFGGTLKDFEQDVTQKDPSKEPPKPSNKDRGHHDGKGSYSGSDKDGPLGEGLDELCGNIWIIVPMAIVAGGVHSWDRVTAPIGGEVDRRRPNEPVIPFIRMDTSYLVSSGGVEAPSARVQAGFGPAAIEYELIRFKEDKTGDRLDIRRVYGLYRMSFGRNVEIDLGIGSLTLEGAAKTTEMVYTVPILIYPTDRWGVEFRPAWAQFEGSTLKDYDLGVFLNWKGGSLKAGYRWLMTDNQDLSGPYIGMAFRY